jgi:hypothetical protein
VFNMKKPLFWHVTPCRCVEIQGCVGGKYCLHLQGRRYAKQQTSSSAPTFVRLPRPCTQTTHHTAASEKLPHSHGDSNSEVARPVSMLYSTGWTVKFEFRLSSLSINVPYSTTRRNLTSWPCRSSAVRRWLPTAAARVRVRTACGVCGRQSGTGAGFLRVLRFPLPIIPHISPLS